MKTTRNFFMLLLTFSIAGLVLASTSVRTYSTTDTWPFKVTDGTTSKPLSGVSVTIRQGLATTLRNTNINGEALFNKVEGECVFTIAKAGYQTISGSLNVAHDSLPSITVKLYKNKVGAYTLDQTFSGLIAIDGDEINDSYNKYRLEAPAKEAPKVAGVRASPAYSYSTRSYKATSVSRSADADYGSYSISPGIVSTTTPMPTRAYITDGTIAGDETKRKRTALNDNIRSGMLTAGEVNDFSKWVLWKDINHTDLGIYRKTWGLYPELRYTILLQDDNRLPLVDAHVELADRDGKKLWESRTDNTGKAELWPRGIDTVADVSKLNCIITYGETVKKVNRLDEFHNGINIVKMQTPCNLSNKVDIAFVVDATGSMGDEIEYLKTELNDVMQKAKSQHADLSFRLGSVFYRDYGDQYVTRLSPFSEDITSTVNFIKAQGADGGGDTPEAMDTAVLHALNGLQWSKDARCRILFLVLDAPPHQSSKELERLALITRRAAALGVRIVPLTASGIDKSTEYLMRCLALTTNGTYVFLTDDSGIGDSHIKPTTDKYKVELLNDLLLRLITQYTTTTSCSQPVQYSKDSTFKDTMTVNNHTLPDPADSSNQAVIDTTDHQQQKPVLRSWKYYPNPTYGKLYIEVEGSMGELFLADQSGKVLRRFMMNEEQWTLTIDISDYSPGIYYLKHFINDQCLDGKVVLLRE